MLIFSNNVSAGSFAFVHSKTKASSRFKRMISYTNQNDATVVKSGGNAQIDFSSKIV